MISKFRDDSYIILIKEGLTQMAKVELIKKYARNIHHLVKSKEMCFMIVEDLDFIWITRNRHHFRDHFS